MFTLFESTTDKRESEIQNMKASFKIEDLIQIASRAEDMFWDSQNAVTILLKAHNELFDEFNNTPWWKFKYLFGFNKNLIYPSNRLLNAADKLVRDSGILLGILNSTRKMSSETQK